MRPLPSSTKLTGTPDIPQAVASAPSGSGMTGKERDSRLRCPMISAGPPHWMAAVMTLKSPAMVAIVSSPNRHTGHQVAQKWTRTGLPFKPSRSNLPPPARSPVRAGALPPARGSDRNQCRMAEIARISWRQLRALAAHLLDKRSSLTRLLRSCGGRGRNPSRGRIRGLWACAASQHG